MGITGELVKSVFSRSRSTKSTHEINVMTSRNMSNVLEKKRWKSTVRAYFCGDELLFNSVVAEEDSTSFRCSEVTVLTQNVFREEEEELSTANNNGVPEQDHHQINQLLDEDVAATIIQSAFRGFLVRRLTTMQSASVKSDFLQGMDSPSTRSSLATSIAVHNGDSVGVLLIDEIEKKMVNHLRTLESTNERNKNNFVKGTESPRTKLSLATSIEVQDGDSVEVVSTEGAPSVSTKLHHKPKPTVCKPKEDWDDSTVDSSISKMRIQNRLEAMSRRERALAYAFSQQLRICSKKKQAKPDPDGMEPNMGWSWLERWMATRQPDGFNNEPVANGTKSTRAIVRNKFLDVSFEGKESCGSNEVPVQVAGLKNGEKDDKSSRKIVRNRLKATKSVSRRKTVPACHYQREHPKESKKEESREAEQNKRQRVKKQGNKRETKYQNIESLSQSPNEPDHSQSCQNSQI